MKRTSEKILAWIGIVIHSIGLLLMTIAIIGLYMTPNNSKTDTTVITLTYIFTIVFFDNSDYGNY